MEQRGFARGTAHTNDEAISTVCCDVALFPHFLRLVGDHLLPEEVTVRVKLVGLDFPQHAHADLQRVEALAVHEHVLAGIAVGRNSIDALVMRVVSASVRHRNGPALGAALALRGLGWYSGGQSRPDGSGLGLRFASGSIEAGVV